MSSERHRIERLEAKVARLERLLAGTCARLSQTTLTTQAGDAEGVDGLPADEGYQVTVRRYQHAGFRSRPPAHSQTVDVPIDGGATQRAVVAEDDGQNASMIDEGEALFYSPSAPACHVYATSDGDLEVNSDTANGKIVQVNGSAANFPRMDQLLPALSQLASDVVTVGAAIGVATPNATTFIANAALPAGANPYLSTKAKNG